MILLLRRSGFRLFVSTRRSGVSLIDAAVLPLLLWFATELTYITSAATFAGEPLPLPQLQRTEPVHFEQEILPLLKRNCLACHQKSDSQGGLILESPVSIVTGGDSGPAVVPNESSGSLLLQRAMGVEGDLMPPPDNTVGASPLTPEQLTLLKLWIDQGAKASASQTSDPIVWHPLADSLRPIYAMDVSPEGQYAALNRGNRVIVIDLSQPAEIAELIDPSVAPEPAADVDFVQTLAFSHDGERIATGGFRTVRIWRKNWNASNPDSLLSQAREVMAFRDDQKVAAWKSAAGEVEVWDLEQTSRLAVLEDLGSSVTSIAWVGPEQALVTASHTGRVAVWNAAEGSAFAHVDLASSPVQLAASRDGTFIAARTQDRQVQLLRLKTAGETEQAALEIVQTSLAEVQDATDVDVLSQPTPAVLIATESRGVLIVDAASQAVRHTLDHGGPVNAFSLSKDETQIVTAGRDGKARLWTVAGGQLTTTLEGTPRTHQALVQAHQDIARQKSRIEKLTTRMTEVADRLKAEDEALAKIHAARDEAAAADAKNQVVLAEAAQKLSADQVKLEQLAAEVAQKMEAAAAANQQLEEAKAARDAFTQQLEKQKTAEKIAQEAKRASEAKLREQQLAAEAAKLAQQRAAEAILAHRTVLKAADTKLIQSEQELETAKEDLVQSAVEIDAIAFDADGQQVLTLHRDETQRVYRASDGQPLWGSDKTVSPLPSELMFCRDRWCGVSETGGVTCWSTHPQWTLERTIGSVDDDQLFEDRITALDFHRDGVDLAVGTGSPSRSGVVKIFNTLSGELIRDYGEIHTDTMLALAFSPDGEILASASSDRTIQLLDTTSDSVRRILEGHTHYVMALAWQDDGRTLASSSADHSVRIWDTETGETLRTLSGYPDHVTSLTYVQGTQQIVAAGGGGHVRLVEASDGRTIRTFQAANDFLSTVGVSRDGTRILSGGQSGVVRIWNLADGKLQSELK